MATKFCTTSSGRLFITDHVSKQRYLVNTGFDLCVFSSKLLPERRECLDYTLCPANGSTIHTYAWTSRSLNMGLRHEFTWRIVIADCSFQSSVYYLLSHYELLVDCWNNRLLDGVTSLSTPSLTAPPS